MFSDIAELFADPEAYVCTWRDGELYIESVAARSAVASLG
jgi:hypothetical protein